MYFTSAYVDMFGHGCGVSRYPQFYDQHLEKYQLLPRPYLGSFGGDNGENYKRKMDIILARWN